MDKGTHHGAHCVYGINYLSVWIPRFRQQVSRSSTRTERPADGVGTGKPFRRVLSFQGFKLFRHPGRQRQQTLDRITSGGHSPGS